MSVAVKRVKTLIPARMDRLPWTRWHWFVIFSLGIVWILDGLEVTIKGAVGPSLRESLGFTTVGVAGVASIYLVGAVSGALFWGYLTDRFGRHKLFIATIAVYIVGVSGTAATGLWILGDGFEYVWFAIFRFITGFGIGGEYAAINSTIDELIPARVRGWADLAINGSYWLGTVVGATLGAVYLNIFPQDVAFRVAFGMGLILGFGILLLRFFVPESPRWLLTHGRAEEAERTVDQIEQDVLERSGLDELPEPDEDDAMELRERRSIGFVELGRTLFGLYPRRSVVAFSLMLTQAFLYNAIFFTFGLMLTEFFDVSNANVGWFLIPFGLGNYMGPLLLGRLFDTVGRRTMIPLTFITAGALTIVAGLLFATGVIDAAWMMTAFWVAIFFFASAGASSGYLTASETFPLEVRAMAISFFYAIPTATGGIVGPILFGTLITGDRWTIFYGYLFAAVLMIVGGLIHRRWGVEAAQKGLESITMPLSAEEAEKGADRRPALEGPAGVNLADDDSIREFQREHDLEPDGVIGPRTAAALSTAAERDGADPGSIDVVDITDPEAIERFQRDHGLEADGTVGRETRGAILAAQRRRLVDPLDEESVRRFQRNHLLDEDGTIGPQTQAAITAVRAEQTGMADTWVEPDVLDRDSVERFQRACGLEPDGVIGPETRGAILEERARRLRTLGVDPADPDSVRDFQRRHGLEDDGIVGGRTRAAMREAREEEGDESALVLRSHFGIDPADDEGVIRFQRAADLEDDGCIGPRTRRALRRAPHLVLRLDPTRVESIERFQREHDLEPDGVIGPRTQAIVAALEDELRQRGRGEEGEIEDEDEGAGEPQLSGLLAFDPGDAQAVERFQREHGLEVDGVIGPRTRAALAAALAEQEQELLARPARPRRHPFERRVSTSRLPAASMLPGEDRELERELQQVLDVLHDRGPMSRDDLADAVNARLWGPGRLRYVLKVGERENAISRVGRARYAARR